MLCAVTTLSENLIFCLFGFRGSSMPQNGYKSIPHPKVISPLTNTQSILAVPSPQSLHYTRIHTWGAAASVSSSWDLSLPSISAASESILASSKVALSLDGRAASSASASVVGAPSAADTSIPTAPSASVPGRICKKPEPKGPCLCLQGLSRS